MAAPTYSTDLLDINLAETNTGWSDINQAGGGGANEAVIDFAIQGSNCISRQVSNTRRGAMYDTGSTVTLGADEHIFTWCASSTPGITDLKSNGGIRVSIGTSTSNYYDYYMNGSDTLPGGGMNNYAVVYGAASASLQNGSPGANPQFFGAQIVTVDTSRGLNFAVDAIRRGTGFYITDGDATTPITFSGSAAINDANANRYGILTRVAGGFSLKGKYVVGQTTAGTPTQAYFDTSNTSLVFVDTEYTKKDFTQIIVDHPSTVFNLSNVTVTGLGTHNPGKIKFLDGSTTSTLSGCLFKTIGTTQLRSGVTAGSQWLQSAEVYQSGSTIDESTFTETNASQSALISDRPDKVSNCTFNGLSSGNDKHGIEVIAAGSYTFTNNTFNNYISGSSSGSALLFNPPGGTGDLTLNVVGGTAPSFTNNSSGTVTINQNVTVTLTGMNPNTEVRVYRFGTNPAEEIAGIENITAGTPVSSSFSFSDQAGNFVDIVIHNLQYNYIKLAEFEIPTTSTSIPISQQFDRNYLNP